MVRSLLLGASVASVLTHVLSLTPADIQGSTFLSPFNGQTVQNLTGIVTAKNTESFWIQGPLSSDNRISSGLRIFTETKSILSSVAVGDEISLSGKVSEFKSSSSDDKDDLLATELDSPTDIVVLSTGNKVTPIVLGKDRSPPTEQLSSLDVGQDGFLSVPNNQSQIDTVNPTVQPDQFGLDFWSSLEGMLVTVPKPTALDFQNEFGEIFVYGDWPVTSQNSRGGLTLIFDPDTNIPDANPEITIIGAPLDGTSNPVAAVGQTFDDVTGVVTYQFGFYYILPTTALVTKKLPSTKIPNTTLAPVSNVCTITIGDYNVDNFNATDPTLPTVANHIATFLKSPDIVFLQEIQDNSGSVDDGTVDADVTLTNLINAIEAINPSVTYDFIEIAPLNDVSGGENGGNIRNAYLFNPAKVQLAGTTVAGNATEATAVTVDSTGLLGLTLNPGLIDPTNTVWDSSRKPLVAVWESAAKKSTGDRFFTVNVHLTSKDGSDTTWTNPRPPINSDVAKRTSQVNVVGTFVQTILAQDANANVIVAGDHNEFLQTRSAFVGYSGILTDVDTISGVADVERYTYVFDYQNEQLDHIFVSDAIANRKTQVEHIHVNNWQLNIDDRASDHDPSVAKLKIC